MTLAPWQQEHFDRALAAYAQGRLGHAQLLVGPSSLGTLQTAKAIAHRLLCTRAQGNEPACGTCKSCAMMQAGTHPDWHEITFAENREGKLRTEITIDQLRSLGNTLQLSSQMGGPVIAAIHPADAMNFAASNTLLKTLEEPQDGRYLFLVASQWSRLSATIRSRCQRMEFRMPPIGEALLWLQDQGIDATTSQAALRAARGNPGLALEWIRDPEILPLRTQVIEQLNQLSQRKADVRTVAKEWSQHERLNMILEFAADHVLDTLQSPTVLNHSQSLALGDWYDRANQARAWLATTLRLDLLLQELLVRWVAIR